MHRDLAPGPSHRRRRPRAQPHNRLLCTCCWASASRAWRDDLGRPDRARRHVTDIILLLALGNERVATLALLSGFLLMMSLDAGLG